MPQKTPKTTKHVHPEICERRIKYANLEIERNKSDTSFDQPGRDAPDPRSKLKVNDDELQGHGLTSALARSCVQKHRWAGVLMSEDSFEDAPDLGGALGITLEGGKQPKCRIDYERYRPFFDDLGISDAQKDEMIEALFLIGHAFYDAGFGVEVTAEACGQVEPSSEDSAHGNKDMVSSKAITLREEFNQCAAA